MNKDHTHFGIVKGPLGFYYVSKEIIKANFVDPHKPTEEELFAFLLFNDTESMRLTK